MTVVCFNEENSQFSKKLKKSKNTFQSTEALQCSKPDLPDRCWNKKQTKLFAWDLKKYIYSMYEYITVLCITVLPVTNYLLTQAELPESAWEALPEHARPGRLQRHLETGNNLSQQRKSLTINRTVLSENLISCINFHNQTFCQKNLALILT